MTFDEQPDGDPHGECALEIRRLQSELTRLQSILDSRPAINADVLREWLDNNTTFYDVDPTSTDEGVNVPVLASVSKRIWYHATDDVESYPFSEVARRALGETK